MQNEIKKISSFYTDCKHEEDMRNNLHKYGDNKKKDGIKTANDRKH